MNSPIAIQYEELTLQDFGCELSHSVKELAEKAEQLQELADRVRAKHTKQMERLARMEDWDESTEAYSEFLDGVDEFIAEVGMIEVPKIEGEAWASISH